MKRFRKALLALAALLGVVIVGSLWLINSALNVASDVVDSTLDGAQKVQAVAQREVVGVAQNAQRSANTTLSDAEHAFNTGNKSASTPAETAPTASFTSKASEQTSEKAATRETKPSAQKDQSAPKNEKNEEDSIADIGDVLNLFFNTGDEGSDVTDLLKLGDKQVKEDKPEAKNADDTLTDMIPGANSPTLKKWMAGKYKGKEGQALDDALEDPKILRAIFLLGGM